MAFIVTSEEKPCLNYLNEVIGTTGKRALCYYVKIGKRRTYRQSFELTKGFKYQTFKTKELAQEASDYVNEAYNDDFKPELL